MRTGRTAWLGWIAIGIAACVENGATTPVQTKPAAEVAAANDAGDPDEADDDGEPENKSAPTDTAGIAKEVAAIKASFDAVNAHDAPAFAAFYAKTALVQSPGTTDWSGRLEISAEMQQAFEEGPDVKWGIRRILVKDDVAIVEWTSTGTAAPPKKSSVVKHFGANGASIMRFGPDGLIKEEYDVINAPTVIAQTGTTKSKVREVLLQPSGTPDVRIAKATPEEAKNIDVVRSFNHAFETHDERAFADAIADDIAWDDYAAPAPISGKIDVKSMFSTIVDAIPDMKLTCKIWGIDDMVATQCTRKGTHEGVLPLGSLKVPATHKSIESHFIDVLQMKHGKIAKASRYSDNLETATELGLVKKQPP